MSDEKNKRILVSSFSDKNTSWTDYRIDGNKEYWIRVHTKINGTTIAPPKEEKIAPRYAL